MSVFSISKSAASDYISGHTMVVDGGWMVRKKKKNINGLL